jgi:hypothetical protein
MVAIIVANQAIGLESAGEQGNPGVRTRDGVPPKFRPEVEVVEVETLGTVAVVTMTTMAAEIMGTRAMEAKISATKLEVAAIAPIEVEAVGTAGTIHFMEMRDRIIKVMGSMQWKSCSGF